MFSTRAGLALAAPCRQTLDRGDDDDSPKCRAGTGAWTRAPCPRLELWIIGHYSPTQERHGLSAIRRLYAETTFAPDAALDGHGAKASRTTGAGTTPSGTIHRPSGAHPMASDAMSGEAVQGAAGWALNVASTVASVRGQM